MEPRLIGDRVDFDNPWIELVALPAALLFVSLFAWSPIGRMLLMPFQIQFHELGHAFPAWLSSRAALPLPFGFTFWSEEPSRFTGLCMVFLIGVLFVRSLREGRRFAVVFALALFVAFVIMSGFVSVERSRFFILCGGLAGELVLTALVMVAFYFPFPDRMRWDFFRFVALVPAAGSWISAVSLWRGVARGTRSLPFGSLLGDGTGDLERLMYEYAFSEHEIISFYGKLSLSTVVLIVTTYAVFALRAGRKLGFVPAWD